MTLASDITQPSALTLVGDRGIIILSLLGIGLLVFPLILFIFNHFWNTTQCSFNEVTVIIHTCNNNKHSSLAIHTVRESKILNVQQLILILFYLQHTVSAKSRLGLQS